MADGILSLSFVEIVIFAFLVFLLLKPSEYKKVFGDVYKWFVVLLRKIRASDGWDGVQKIVRDIKAVPKQAMREADIEEDSRIFKDALRSPSVLKPDPIPKPPPKNAGNTNGE